MWRREWHGHISIHLSPRGFWLGCRNRRLFRGCCLLNLLSKRRDFHSSRFWLAFELRVRRILVLLMLVRSSRRTNWVTVHIGRSLACLFKIVLCSERFKFTEASHPFWVVLTK